MEMFLILSQFYTCFFNTKRTNVFLNYGQVKQLNCQMEDFGKNKLGPVLCESLPI